MHSRADDSLLLTSWDGSMLARCYRDEGQAQAALAGTPHAGINGIRTGTEIPTPAQGTRRNLIAPSFPVKAG